MTNRSSETCRWASGQAAETNSSGPIAQCNSALRFHLGGQAVRVTYWIASGRRIVLLTVFLKTRMRQTREIERAQRALKRCIAAAHTAEDDGEEK
jgi:hypothetical protein